MIQVLALKCFPQMNVQSLLYIRSPHAVHDYTARSPCGPGFIGFGVSSLPTNEQKMETASSATDPVSKTTVDHDSPLLRKALLLFGS